MNDQEIAYLVGITKLKLIDSIIQKSYSMGKLFIDDTTFFQTPSAKSFIQIVFNLGIDYNIMKACDDGILNFAYSFERNRANNCKHIELIGCGLTLTHSSVKSKFGFPREAIFRKDLAYTNQMSLFETKATCPNYGILTHMSCKTHLREADVMFGVPDCDYKGWANLLDLETIVPESSTPKIVAVDHKEYSDFSIVVRKQLASLEQ